MAGKQQTDKQEKQFYGALRRAIIGDSGERLRRAAEQLLDHAANGEYWAINMLADRLDGKPTQQLQALDEEGRSVAVALITYSNPPQLPAETVSTTITESTGLRH